MPTIRAELTRRLAADPARVYAIIADYREGHQRILPRPPFTTLDVLEGGTGHGTVIRFGMRSFGTERVVTADIAEREPGRVLLETIRGSGAVTIFRVTPVDGGAEVTISTEWTTPGIRGVVESLLAPSFLRKVYALELALLAAEASR